MPTFDIGTEDFLLDGRRMQVVSGALHYFRVHPDQWADRIRKARLMGLNTIETYVPWNFHAPEPGVFDLTGRRDLGRFLDLVAAEGLNAIVRPGPYICAEWDGGGLPAWLFADAAVGVRRHEPLFLSAIGKYYANLLPLVAERQVTRGGPVLMVQVENEYGAYGDDPLPERQKYLRALVDLTRDQGIDVPLFTCDQADDEMLARGGLPELHKTATFGSRSTERLEILRRHQPTGPLMCMEFWNGWFDSWGLEHHVAPAEANAADLDDLLAAGGSVNLYMFHGGTNFGLTSGANDKGIYRPITTSYDYDAPLAEDGTPTAKYWAMREVIARHLPVADVEWVGDVAGSAVAGSGVTGSGVAGSGAADSGVTDSGVTDSGAAPVFDVALTARVPLPDALPGLLRDELRSFASVPTTDDLELWSGFAVYRTAIRADDAVLSVGEVRDRAVVLVDGEQVGVLDRGSHTFAVALPARAGELTLLVEDQGRVNYGPRIGEPKGLIGPVRTAVRTLDEWEAGALRVEDAPELLRAALDAASAAAAVADGAAGAGNTAVADGAAGTRNPSVADGAAGSRNAAVTDGAAGAGLHRGTFDSVAGADHFLRLDGWTKGLAWINGELLGRYWSLGPTHTLYVPGPLVRDTGNELVLLELHGAATTRASFVAGPALGITEQ
ncbi:beta-galactosidase [Promicromonospora sp. AC04]|uniref:glycoside hydrolase family 35 protein n=1 Tax=Promicromonospora sp. AC04 TaxID=2135723 RepID=UPI000D339D62|nr:beta-galactosidase family protein [Promicromonospora sp. AC04]PUB24508.1 beta-galactosidase [Promicromonospora sp. AC04]